MADIMYVDYEGAAGTGDGSSFANRASSVAALTKNGGNYGNSYLYATGQPWGNSQPNDSYEIRIKASPAPTQLSTGCKIVKRAADSKNGYNSRNMGTVTYSTTTGATSMNWSSHKVVTGDWITIVNNTQYHTSNDFANRMGLNGRWKVTRVDDNNFTIDGYTAPSASVAGGNTGNWWVSSGAVVELPSSGADKWKPIACTDAKRAKWVASSNVTTYDPYWSVSTWSETYNVSSMMSDRIEISGSFTTGKVAYYELPATLDLSAFQQVSWNIIATQGKKKLRSNGDHGISFRLCSDTTGDTTVDTIPWEGEHLANTGYWQAMVRNKGSALGNSIRSIAIYLDERVDNYTGSYNFWIHNVCACKAPSAADSVTHRSLLGKNTPAMQSWYRIVELGNHKEICFGSCNFQRRRSIYSYYNSGDVVWWDEGGTNVTIWKREPVLAPPRNSSTQEDSSGDLGGAHEFEFSRISGPSGSAFAIVSGGWNPTDMSSQVNDGTGNPYTCIDWVNNLGGWRSSSGGGPHRIKDLYFVSAYYGPYLTSTKGMLDNTGHHQCYGQNGIKCSWNEHSGIGMRQYSHNQNSQVIHHSLDPTAWNRTYNAPSSPVWYIRNASCMPYNNSTLGLGNSWTNNSGDAVVWTYINVENCKGVSLGGGPGAGITTIRAGYPFTSMNDYGMYCNYSLNIGTAVVHSMNGIYTNQGTYGPITIDHFTHDALDGDNGENSQYQWSSSYSQYAIEMGSNSNDLIINDGEIDKRARVYKGHLKLTGVVNNDSQSHDNYGGEISVKNHNDVLGANTFYGDGYTIEPETTTRNTNSGFAWKFTSTNSNKTGSYEIAKFAVASGGTVAVKVHMYKAGGTGGIKIIKNTDIGMTADVITENTTDGSNTWIEKTAYIQPNAAGIITVALTIRGGSGSTIFDDMSITQS
tara:strand:- start:1987 stop:4740 length:2754 start_codon:yes stop_codon:yes gene_type:complete